MKEAETFGLTLRRRRRPHRQEARPRELAAPSAPPTWSASTRWRTSSRRCRTTSQDDPFFASYATPPVLAEADRAGRAGPEDRRRLLQEGRQGHPAPRPGQGRLRAGGGKADEIVARILKKPPAERLKLLRESKNPQAQFLWAILRDSFHYAAVHLADIADTARDVDFAMRWGFGMQPGPVRAVAGRPAGRRSRSGSRKTSTPARR